MSDIFSESDVLAAQGKHTQDQLDRSTKWAQKLIEHPAELQMTLAYLKANLNSFFNSANLTYTRRQCREIDGYLKQIDELLKGNVVHNT